MTTTSANGYVRLYREASTWHRVVLFCSVLMAISAGTALPLLTIVIGHEVGEIKEFASGREAPAQFRDSADRYSIYFVYFGLAQLVVVYLSTVGFMFVGDHVSRRISQDYLRALLYQDIGFFDTLGAGEATARLTDGVHLVHASVSEKAAAMLMATSTVLAAVVVSLVSFWKLALISMSSLVALVLLIGIVSRFLGTYSTRSLQAHAQSAQVAEEALSSMAVVKALGAAGSKLADKFDEHLARAAGFGRRAKVALGGLIGGVLAISMLNVGLMLWQGSRYIMASETSPGAVSTITLSMLIGTFTLVTLAPIIATIASGLAAASKIFALMDRESLVDASTEQGLVLVPDEFLGNIEFKNTTFSYPSRPDSLALRNVSFTIPAGKVTGIVGASGSGKSTFVNLLQRFYQPNDGAVLIDGHSVSEFNVRWLRGQMALVDQEPVLFSDTVLENIIMGLTSSNNMTEAEEMDLAVGAAKQSGAHAFISSLPDGYYTVLNEGGGSLSGGQKQRIAISRAIVRNPRILLLDEASSALDAKSERHIQSAVNSTSSGHRTTVIITHQMSTVRDADNIVVVSEGQVVEQGSHDELYGRRGVYYALLNTQQQQDAGDGAVRDESPGRSQAGESGVANSVASEKVGQHEFHQYPCNISDLEVPEKVSEGTLGKPLPFRRPEPEPDNATDSVKPVQKYSIPALLRFVLSMNRPELPWMALGLLASVISGSGTPIHVLFLSHGITTLSLPDAMHDKMQHDISFWGAMYIMLAAVLLLVNVVHSLALGFSSERLMSKAKGRAFRAMLNQDLSFFSGHQDRQASSTGALVSFLSTEPAALGGISGPILGTLISVSTTVAVAVAIAIGYGWKLGLVCTSTVPILLLSGFLRLHLLARMERKTKAVFEKATVRAREAITAIRTVASLALEEAVLSRYQEELRVQRRAHIMSVSVLYAMSYSLFFFCMALSMWYGTGLLAGNQYSVLQLWVCFVEIMFSTQSAGALFAFAPDLAKAQEAARRLKEMIDRDPGRTRMSERATDALLLRDTSDEKSESRSKENDSKALDGRIEFRDVEFAYPSRPTHTVLKRLSLKVEPGQFVALVGASGCGKSTLISLLERFYNPSSGSILVGGKDISSLDVDVYRSHIALVNQDICLFQGTVRENILLGVANGEPPLPEDDIVACCKAANIHDLVMSLPDGLDTDIGTKGHLLSGGQRQRIAIARALIRKPRLLLLDEAMSKLDSASEAGVQAALDAAAEGRTTISVTHTLSSIMNADVIYVLGGGGTIVEQGTHRELMERRGAYFEFAVLQNFRMRDARNPESQSREGDQIRHA